MTDIGTERTERRSQGQRAYEFLRQQILDWALVPGTPISENDISRQLGGSRTPVREAIQQLSREGLVRTMPGRGAFVAEISFSDIVELFEMREALEVGVARMAARAPDRSSLNELEPEFQAFRDLINSTDNATYYALIRRFDEALLALCGNQRMAQALAEVWSQVHRLRHIAATDAARLTETVAEHVEILRAVAAGQEDQAAACVLAHVRKSAENVLRNVTNRGGQRYLTM